MQIIRGGPGRYVTAHDPIPSHDPSAFVTSANQKEANKLPLHAVAGGARLRSLLIFRTRVLLINCATGTIFRELADPPVSRSEF